MTNLTPTGGSALGGIEQDIFNFAIDYLEVYWELSWVRDIALWLDADNSNYKNYDGFEITLDNNIRNYEYKLTFFKKGVPCFWVYRGVMINEFIETKDYVCFYGSAFSVLWESYILEFIRDHIAFEKIKRFDLCLDITQPIDEVLRTFKDINQIGSKFYWVGGQIETVYIGQKKRKNKQSLIRIYNKIADIYAKGKQKLMAEYLNHESMTRIEIEFREEISCHIPFEMLSDKKYLIDTFYSYIEKHTPMFKDIGHEKIILRRLQKKFDHESVESSRLVPGKYRKLFMGYWKRVLSMGSCPVDILLRNDIISDTTLKDIWTSCYKWEFDSEYYRLWATIRNWKQVFAEEWNREDDLPF